VAENEAENGPQNFGARIDPAAEEMALANASRGEADAFLRAQRELIADQRHHLHEQLKELGLGLWEKRMGVVLRFATLVVGLAVAGGLAMMVWDAAHSHGLVIAPFSVPPALRERGLDGEVIASQVIDKLNHMTTSESSRAVQSYANNWGENIKVEIPETGVSIGELRDFLREWLGHDIRISGEVYRTADGIAVTARTGGDEGATFTGKEGDLDSLLQKAAEHVYETTQPYRYANYLDRNYDPRGAAQRVAHATAIYRKLIAGGDRKEQAWAWNGLATIQFNFYADNRKSYWYYQKALAADPDFVLGYYAISARSGPLGQEEDNLRSTREFVRRAEQGAPDLNPRYASSALAQSKGRILYIVGDFAAAVPILVEGAERTDSFSVLGRVNFTSFALAAMVQLHDQAAVRAYLKALGWTEIPGGPLSVARFWNAVETEDWRSVLAIEAGMNARSASDRLLRGKPISNGDFNPSLWPLVAYAHARMGDIAGAERLIAPLADDNAAAVRMHAMIAELEGEHARADWWFARSEAQTPSIPQTDLWWGQALLKRGQPDAAIEKFKLANAKGPHFADPLEGWGEALMAKNHSDRAIVKFAESEKYAPNWGRLHLKWGEALVWAGKPDEAKVQFARAAALDLTPVEKAELGRMVHG
jgi:tetratricopeptide (TPR) repeat protein